MKALARISSGGLVFMGAVHVAVTGSNYDLASSEALFFAGSGLMLVAAGLLTLSATLTENHVVRMCSVIVNLLGFTLAIFAVPILNEPHVYLLIAFYVMAMISVSMLMFKSQV